jgi:hypothetical protein
MPTAIQRHYLSLLYYYVHIIQSIFMCAVQESNRAPYVRSGRHLLYLWNSLYSNNLLFSFQPRFHALFPLRAIFPICLHSPLLVHSRPLMVSHRRPQHSNVTSSSSRPLHRYWSQHPFRGRHASHVILSPAHLYDLRPITIDSRSPIHQSLGSPVLAPRIRRVSFSGNKSNPFTVQHSLSLPGTPLVPGLIFPPLPVESSTPPLPSTALRHAHALRTSRAASPPVPSTHGGTLPSTSRSASASSATRTSTPQHRSHSPPAHDPRTRTFSQRSRAPRSSSRLSHYGPVSPVQLLYSLPFSSPRSASTVQRTPVPLRAPCTPRSPASSRPIPALILVQRRLLARQRSRSSRRR